MPKAKKIAPVKRVLRTSMETKISKNRSITSLSLIDRIQAELKSNQSYLSLVLGLLIVLVAGVLVFNYLKKNQASLGPAQQFLIEESKQDAEPDNLPGKYTVKEGDTLYTIADKYYKDGYKFPVLAETNKLSDANVLTVGQVLDIPALEESTLASTDNQGTGGAVNQTIWGETIQGDSYTVVEGDWLSTIAGRAYGDIMAFDKIAKANNISNPDVIEPGTVLSIPR